MKRIIVILVSVVLLAGVSLAWSGEREELGWQFRALLAEANLYQTKLEATKQAIQQLAKDIEAKGYVIQQDGTITEKPKAAPESKPVPPGGGK